MALSTSIMGHVLKDTDLYDFHILVRFGELQYLFLMSVSERNALNRLKTKSS